MNQDNAHEELELASVEFDHTPDLKGYRSKTDGIFHRVFGDNFVSIHLIISPFGQFVRVRVPGDEVRVTHPRTRWVKPLEVLDLIALASREDTAVGVIVEAAKAEAKDVGESLGRMLAIHQVDAPPAPESSLNVATPSKEYDFSGEDPTVNVAELPDVAPTPLRPSDEVLAKEAETKAGKKAKKAAKAKAAVEAVVDAKAEELSLDDGI